MLLALPMLGPNVRFRRAQPRKRSVAKPPIPADKAAQMSVRFRGIGYGGWMTGLGA